MRLTASLFLLLMPLVVPAQTGNPSNSFADYYQRANPDLKYRYDSINFSHDYSGNWDLDGDGKKDQVFFVGTGGAHLYYYLRLRLSSERKTRDFRFIESDMPIIEPGSLEVPGKFTFQDLAKNGQAGLVLYMSRETRAANEKALKKHGVKGLMIFVGFSEGKINVRDAVQK